MKVNLISHDNGVGLSADMRIIRKALPWIEFEFFDPRKGKCRNADINLFLEITDRKLMKYAGLNILIPNPEWHFDRPIIGDFDIIFAKTRDGERIFKNLGGKEVVFTSFTSEDRYDPSIEKKRMFLHLSGRSQTKGSWAIWNAFNQSGMPEMIFLKYAHTRPFEGIHSNNVYPYFQRLDLEQITNLQNSCYFHLCPSEYEGFGHYIWEAKSAGGIVLTTNHPPMNEFVTHMKDGILVEASNHRRMNLAIIAKVSALQLSKGILALSSLGDEKLKEMSQASRQTWVDNDKYFKEIINQIFKNL